MPCFFFSQALYAKHNLKDKNQPAAEVVGLVFQAPRKKKKKESETKVPQYLSQGNKNKNP
jgi:hypothetical protein